MNVVVECDNCGKPQTFHLRDRPCLEDKAEHLCSECFDAEVSHLMEMPIERLLAGETMRDRSIHGPLKPSP